jgi:hypothetical protein
MSIDPISLKNYMSMDASVANSAQPPMSITPDAISQSIPTRYSKSTIVPIGSNSIGAGQTLEFLSNFSDSSFIKAGSMYITANLNVTGVSSTGTFGFKGSQGDFSRLFQRMTISVAGQIVEDLNFYNEFCSDVNNVFLNNPMNQNLQSVLLGGVAGQNNFLAVSNKTGAAGGSLLTVEQKDNFAGNATLRVCIRLNSSFLNGGLSQEDIPTCLLVSPIQIRLVTDTVNNIFVSPLETLSAFTLSDIRLNYTSIFPDPSYVSALIAGVNAGKMYPLCLSTYNAFKPQLTSSYSVLQTVNARSCNAVAISFKPASKNSGLTAPGYCASPTGSTSSDTGNLQVYYDGTLITQYPNLMAPAADKLSETVLAVYGNISDPSISLPFTQLGSQNVSGSYLGQYYSVIVSSQNYHDSDCIKRGMPVSQLRIEGTYQNSASGDVMNIYALYEKIVFFGAMGSVTMVQ